MMNEFINELIHQSINSLNKLWLACSTFIFPTVRKATSDGVVINKAFDQKNMNTAKSKRSTDLDKEFREVKEDEAYECTKASSRCSEHLAAASTVWGFEQ